MKRVIGVVGSLLLLSLALGLFTQSAAPATAADAPTVQFYAGQIAASAAVWQISESALVGLVASPQFGVTSWQEDVSEQLGVWKALATYTASLTPPASMQQVNGLVVQAFAAYGQAADDVRAGIDQQDASQFTAATNEINTGNMLINQATAAMGQAGVALPTGTQAAP